MDIAAISMSLNQAKLQEAVSLSVLKMALGNNQNSTTSIAELMQASTVQMERSVQPHLGSTIDMKA